MRCFSWVSSLGFVRIVGIMWGLVGTEPIPCRIRPCRVGVVTFWLFRIVALAVLFVRPPTPLGLLHLDGIATPCVFEFLIGL
jgi:hypothetical protein